MAGVEGRLIQENVLIANELLDSNLNNGDPGVKLKIDFTKSLDHVLWEFLNRCLGDISLARGGGFG